MLSPGFDHQHVPREEDANVRFRLAVLDFVRGRPKRQQFIRQLCANDIVYWINVFVVQYNPRKLGGEAGPFITWDFQDDAIREMLRAIEDGGEVGVDLLIEKSREMGASWLCLIVMLWLMLFRRRVKFLCVSKSEEAVESDDPDSLFWKLDYVLRYMPDWLLPKGGIKRRKRFFGNSDYGSSITGVASTGDAGVGGRATAVFIDEFSVIKDDFKVLHHTSDTASCRIFNGTHRGEDTAFYEVSQRVDVRKLRMHWSQHPAKRLGLYRYDPEGGKIEVLDKTYKYPVDFNFVMDGSPTGGPYPGLRSPWYDAQCLRKGSARAIAMDLDINAKGSATQFFDAVTIQYLKRLCLPPLWEGDIDYERDTGQPLGLVAGAGGPIKLWLRPMLQGGCYRPPQGKYVAGADISAGTGATESCFSIANAATGEKVLEFATAHMQPHAFAVVCVALCRLFCGARFCWERGGGVGIAFGQRVVELGYDNFYFQTYEVTISNKPSQQPGWFPTPDSKRTLLEDYRSALNSKLFLNRSEKALDETLSFKYDKSGNVKHAQEENTEDPSRARANHGDRVIADALCNKMVKESGIISQKRKEEAKPLPDVRSLAGRMALYGARVGAN